MHIVRILGAAAGIAALAACGQPAAENNVGDDNAMMVDNLVVNDVVTDPNMMMNDMNAMDMNATDMNMDMNAGTGTDTATNNTGY